tara:strand:+ start:2010 stop:2210 length:201 start_codon:yes stop_codon:yes gene_type:complete
METYELLNELRKQRRTYKTAYAIKRNDGKIFPERYTTREQAQAELNYRLGNGATSGLAWIIEMHQV